jgi:hypothetical protein
MWLIAFWTVEASWLNDVNVHDWNFLAISSKNTVLNCSRIFETIREPGNQNISRAKIFCFEVSSFWGKKRPN